jgi:prepilin-type N-terminal cleavage/methylation domain-containing protein
MKKNPNLPNRGRSQAGFTLAELLVSLAVMAILLVAILTVFDLNNRVSRVQVHISDMQQSLRIAQYDLVRRIRMAGRGGLPQAQAVAMRNNEGLTGAQKTILVGQDSPLVVRGSDVVTVRGVFSTPVYQIDSANPDSFTVNPLTGTGTLKIRDPGPTGVPQDLAPFRRLLGNGDDPAVPDAILLASPLSDAIYAVVELVPASSSVVTAGGVTTATLEFKITGGLHTGDATAGYRSLYNSAGAFPLATVGSAGILEEYRFYLRDHRPDGGVTLGSAPKLSVARVFPGTEAAYGGDDESRDQNLGLDVADNILDLQIALGFDANADGQIVGAPAVAANADEWRFNDAGDAALGGNLAYVRLNTLARTDRPDPQFVAPLLEPLEDRDYTGSDLNLAPTNANPERFYRRRILQTLVDLRNLG